MKQEIEAKLDEINEKHFYGLVPQNVELSLWDYCVIRKGRANKKSPSSLDLQNYIQVAIVREEKITDETLIKIIQAILSIPGIRLADESIDFDYEHKGNSDMVCEVAIVTFTRTIKNVIRED